MGSPRFEVELAYQGTAEPDEHPIFQEFHLYVLPNEGTADEVAPVPQRHAAVLPHFSHIRRIRIFPRRTVLLEGVGAGCPTLNGPLHFQSLMRTDVIVLL